MEFGILFECQNKERLMKKQSQLKNPYSLNPNNGGTIGSYSHLPISQFVLRFSNMSAKEVPNSNLIICYHWTQSSTEIENLPFSAIRLRSKFLERGQEHHHLHVPSVGRIILQYFSILLNGTKGCWLAWRWWWWWWPFPIKVLATK